MSTNPTTPIPQTTPATTSSPAAERRGVRSTTVVWGLLLMAAGVLVAALGLGYRLDAITFAVIVSATLGVALLLLAVLPRRRHPQATVTVYGPPAPTERFGATTAPAQPAVPPTRAMPATADGGSAETERIETPTTPAAPTEQLTNADTAPHPTEPPTADTDVLEAGHDAGEWWNPHQDRGPSTDENNPRT